jgi:hypothetical protein
MATVESGPGRSRADDLLAWEQLHQQADRGEQHQLAEIGENEGRGKFQDEMLIPDNSGIGDMKVVIPGAIQHEGRQACQNQR